MITKSDLIRVSLRQVLRQKTYGVICSIALGITAFIVLAVLGQEIRYKIGQDMILMGGVNIMQVTMYNGEEEGGGWYAFSGKDEKDIRALPGVDLTSVGHKDSRWLEMRVPGDRMVGFGLLGIDANFLTMFGATVEGKPLTQRDIDTQRRVCLIGSELAKNAYGSAENALGQFIYIDNDVFQVIGVASGMMLGGDTARSCMIGNNVRWDHGLGGDYATKLYVRASSWEDVDRLTKEIARVIHTNQPKAPFRVRVNTDQMDQLKSIFLWVEALLWLGIVAALMLGGFSIWSGTFAAVRARTREVGLKKSMGGSDSDIMEQFLCEALFKALAGGLLGVIVGVGSVLIGVHYLGSPLPLMQLLCCCAGSIAFSALLGVGGGIMPAMQASRMDVVSALRFE